MSHTDKYILNKQNRKVKRQLPFLVIIKFVSKEWIKYFKRQFIVARLKYEHKRVDDEYFTFLRFSLLIQGLRFVMR